jgi:hypothetical protein
MTVASFSKETTVSSRRVRLGALSLVLAGIFFLLYPALRPFSDTGSETSLQAAEAFASPYWVLAHMLAVGGFILVALSLLSLHTILQKAAVERLVSVALVVTWIGAGFTLPYFGAEIFGLHAIGQEAIRQNSVAIMPLVHNIRYGPAIYVFAVGLILLAVGPILVGIAVWRSGSLSRWSGSLFALGFALYIPQFFGTQPIRVAHGLLMTIGCIWLAWSMLQSQQRSKTVQKEI